MMISRSKIGAMALLSAFALSLGGCADGVELNGKIFDALGVSESASKAAARESNVPVRAGIVLPPDANRLPEPGSGSAEPDVAAQLNDPDRKRVMAAAERERLHKAHCTGEANWKDRVNKKPGSEVPTSPFGPCTWAGGAINGLSKE
jgi:hypothetical protein